MYAHETTIKSPDAFLFTMKTSADARIYRACRISTGLEDGQKMFQQLDTPKTWRDVGIVVKFWGTWPKKKQGTGWGAPQW